MTSRERMLRCVEFDSPDRVPRDLWTLPICVKEHGREAMDAFRRRWPKDMVHCPVGEVNPRRLVKGSPTAVGYYRDEWGCEFENILEGVHGEVKQPLVAEWSDLEKVQPPRERLELDYNAIADYCGGTEQFVQAGCAARPFERMQFLRGSEDLYLDLAEESDELRQLMNIVHGFFVEQAEAWAKSAVDMLFIMDDWGSQGALLISPDQWRRLFKPLYAEYAKIAHDAGKKVFMHSDGHIFDIYEDLIDVGIDAVNSQLFCMDIETIGQRFGGRITFWGEIDRQSVLPSPRVEDAKEAVERVAAALHRPEGGVIAQFEIGAGARLENAEMIFRTWEAVGQ